jgi:23S rRNA G2069 N7-methylase RlmK/C1962 C5-methylase RlmI
MSAIDLANENVDLNNLNHEKISYVKEDVIEFMKQALSRNEEWDLVILDPPKLAPRKKVTSLPLTHTHTHTHRSVVC